MAKIPAVKQNKKGAAGEENSPAALEHSMNQRLLICAHWFAATFGSERQVDGCINIRGKGLDMTISKSMLNEPTTMVATWTPRRFVQSRTK